MSKEQQRHVTKLLQNQGYKVEGYATQQKDK
jgi:hypothetical protein